MISIGTKTLIAIGAASLFAAAPATAEPPAAPSGAISISDGQVRATLGGSDSSAAYMVITNAGPRPDRLLSVACDCAAQAEVHRSQMMGGMMTMAPAGPVEIPARGRVAFAPGGLHVMLTGLKAPLVDGHSQAMSLRFERAGQVMATFQVRARIVGEGMAPMPGMNP